MTTYELTQSFPDQISRNTDSHFPDPAEGASITEDLAKETLSDLQRTKEELRLQATALRTRNKELEAYAQMVAHDLKTRWQ
jgi:hypothetical protein